MEVGEGGVVSAMFGGVGAMIRGAEGGDLICAISPRSSPDRRDPRVAFGRIARNRAETHQPCGPGPCGRRALRDEGGLGRMGQRSVRGS